MCQRTEGPPQAISEASRKEVPNCCGSEVLGLGGLPGGRQFLTKDEYKLGKRLGLEWLDKQGQKEHCKAPGPRAAWACVHTCVCWCVWSGKVSAGHGGK